ncbi:preprotein translocase subunit SecA [Porticoccaceae bacterium]|jgi:preprotein translocase subunit SecA|nr:preprotein translocase subunit SecA [Porticoccaceae bacterium]MDB4581299.1 preprotein translocase subunit SecA [Porticoccaceae bacterium]MDC0589652.1 preprotein translocase subunit SecA [Porticoccaceae bacterium]MDG1080575.1 preprotein translocase subunit SecA [Porticoccaceae bacterium]
MFANMFKKVFGSKNDREIRKLGKTVVQINQLEAGLAALSDADLKAETLRLRGKLEDGSSLDQLLPEAFALVRETSNRVMGMRHFDVQMIGGMALHQGRIAEMRTGEGKTLVATLAAYLNALPANGVHVITVNDYLARRDAQWMAPLYQALGLSVGVIQSYQGPDSPNSFLMDQGDETLRPSSRREAYAADITYGTNNEFGFDYLRDNMALRQDDKSQRGLSFAIVDEVDSILIDEARTPLVISGAAQDSSSLYRSVNALTLKLASGTEEEPGDFIVDEKTRSVELSEDGFQKVEDILIKEGLLTADESLYQAANLGLLHHVHSALRAQNLFQRDVEYIVEDNQAVLIDEHTGRTMPGRRLSEGLHQAIEAKEGLNIQQESQTLASTTFQNYFRLYEKLAGMTGTADTEAFEFQQIYGLEVMVIPTNVEVKRQDLNDLVFLTQEEKFEAVIEDIADITKKGAPVLVGTASVETSELLSQMLKKAGVKHNVLNAKQHEREANIIVEAGRPGAVTIATNMAGRGTDIVLGGNVEAEIKELDNPSETRLATLRSEWQERHKTVIDAGGLHIVATERHESRRIDNQLRGRSGRQGDPGVSRFYLSLEDPLMRLFASDRIKNMMRSMGMEHGESIEHSMVTNAIVKAQRKVEGRNFDIRKHLLEYDDVANDQRQVIYQQRNDLLEDGDISDVITAVREDVVTQSMEMFIPPQSLEEQWDIEGLEKSLHTDFTLQLPIAQWLEEDSRLDEETLRARVIELVEEDYQTRYADVGAQMREVERQIMLQVLDTQWKDHLANMDQLRQGIGLRAYAQKNPKQEYKRESFAMFEELLANIKYETIRFLSHIQVASDEDMRKLEAQRRKEQEGREYQHAQSANLAQETGEEGAPAAQPVQRLGPKVGRNDPCPCGSGKKYKQCHGKIS